MGLSAVVLGALARRASADCLAAGVTLLRGPRWRTLNAFMISRLDLPPLIVTLGTFSLFRGIAEGLTRGIENYSGFSRQVSFSGTGLCWRSDSNSTSVLVVAVAGFGWWLHRTVYGRSLYAIGHSEEGARYAGINVSRKLVFRLLAFGICRESSRQSSTSRIWARRSLTRALVLS